MNPVTAMFLTFAFIQLPATAVAIYFAATANKRSMIKTVWLSVGCMFLGLAAVFAVILIVYRYAIFENF